MNTENDNDIKRTIIQNYMDKNNKTTLTIDEILELIEENEPLKTALHNEYMHEMHKEDILMRIDTLNEERDTPITLDDDTINEMIEYYEDRLTDSEDWYYILTECFKRFEIGEEE